MGVEILQFLCRSSQFSTVYLRMFNRDMARISKALQCSHLQQVATERKKIYIIIKDPQTKSFF